MGISRAQYGEALEASDLIATAADLIDEARKTLDKVPSRFMDRLNQVAHCDTIDTPLVRELTKLADRISLDADYASEQAA